MTNFHEIDLTLKEIEADPEAHDQAWWGSRSIVVNDRELRTPVESPACRTTMCAAGFTVVRHGWELLFSREGIAEVCAQGGRRRLIRTVAQEILDLSEYQADTFFGSNGTLESLHALRDRWAESEGYKP